MTGPPTWHATFEGDTVVRFQADSEQAARELIEENRENWQLGEAELRELSIVDPLEPIE